jgi:hypothetical protein
MRSQRIEPILVEVLAWVFHGGCVLNFDLVQP